MKTLRSRKAIVTIFAACLLSTPGTIQAQPMPGTQQSQGVVQATTINVNTATALQLEALPGVGPKLAKTIIEYRTTNGPFKSAEELGNVTGIGPKKLEGMRQFISIQ